MELVSLCEIAPTTADGGADCRRLSGPLETTAISINHYRLEPGDRISGLHAHGDQEEVFVGLSGTATFETLAGTRTIDPGEAIRFAPGEYQSALNDTPEDVELLALGAPRDSEDVRIPVPCSACGMDWRRVSLTDDGPALSCPDCGVSRAAECEACGSERVRAELAEDGDSVVSVCPGCGGESSS